MQGEEIQYRAIVNVGHCRISRLACRGVFTRDAGLANGRAGQAHHGSCRAGGLASGSEASRRVASRRRFPGRGRLTRRWGCAWRLCPSGQQAHGGA
jgi:hypothetical protein